MYIKLGHQCGSPVNRCRSPLYIANAWVSSYTSDIGTTIQVDCKDGYRFKDGQKTKYYDCLASGQWQDMDFCHSM